MVVNEVSSDERTLSKTEVLKDTYSRRRLSLEAFRILARSGPGCKRFLISR